MKTHNIKKLSFYLLTAIAVGSITSGTVLAGPGKPVKRTLSTPILDACASSDSVYASVQGDCNSQNANVKLRLAISYTYHLNDDLSTTEVDESLTEQSGSGNTYLEKTIALVPNDIICSFTSGETSFSSEEISGAADALILIQLPSNANLGTVQSSVKYSSVSAKAWTTKNSYSDSKPASVIPTECLE